MKATKVIINSVIGIGLLVILWHTLVMISDPGESMIPLPISVLKAIGTLIENGTFWEHIGVSLYRFITGYIIAAIVAIILGLILGWYKWAWDIVNPIVQVIRPIAPTAWFPFIVIIFGIGNLPAIVIIFIAAFFPILLSTVTAVGKIDPTYLKVASNFGIKKIKFITKIVLPAIFPYTANALHIALGTAWIFLVSGEMVGAQSGLGYLIIDARNNLRQDFLLAGIVLIGIMGLILDKLIGLFERKVAVKWGKAQ